LSTGERMKLRRKELGYSADFIAEKLNVSRSTIFRYEGGDIEKLPIDILEPLSEILHTTPAYLMGWDSKNQTDVTTLTKSETELLNRYRKLDDIGKYTVDTTLDAQYKRCTTSTKNHELRAAHIDDNSDEQMELLKQDLDEL
jgi:transcriptional regulator with XRE-family HTH domain